MKKKTKSSVHKKSSLVTPELIPGLVFEFQNNLRGQHLFICYKIRSKKGPIIRTLELFEVLYKNKRAAQNINWKNCTSWECIGSYFCRSLWCSKWDIWDYVIVIRMIYASILRYHFEKKNKALRAQEIISSHGRTHSWPCIWVSKQFAGPTLIYLL